MVGFTNGDQIDLRSPSEWVVHWRMRQLAVRVEVAWNGVQYRVKAPSASLQHLPTRCQLRRRPVRIREYVCLGLQFEWRRVSIGRLNIDMEPTVDK
jgi:hypothetical protein